MKANRSRIVLVNDHPLAAEAISQHVNATDDMETVGIALDSQSGLRLSLNHRANLVVIDPEVPGQGTFSLINDLAMRLPKSRVVLWGDYFSDVMLDEALRMGVAGYLLTNEPTGRIIDHLRAACRGEAAFSPEVMERLEFDRETRRYRAKYHSDLAMLTNRQLTVLRQLAKGKSVRDVAKTMALSERAVESHKYRIMRRLGIHDRVELARYAIREGLTVP